MDYYLSQNGLEWPGGAPLLGRKWIAWRRNRAIARSRQRRRLPPFPGEPRERDFRLPAGRMHFHEAHWLWFEATFSPRVKQVVEDAIEKLLTDLRAAGRFAPVPSRWDEFYRRVAAGYDREQGPPMPLILSSHWSSTAAQKNDVLRGQLLWAKAHGRLGAALFHLRGLVNEDWRPLPMERWQECGDL
ncbi:hypothetical protein [Tsuneonella rigui]|uniref:hypothetical protein n=1 Tax=Tsuneonella rigui TaxID=1708790 RepID=UPI000F7EE9F3|nr:hypothetical protein [Tsuneonella rigui]